MVVVVSLVVTVVVVTDVVVVTVVVQVTVVVLAVVTQPQFMRCKRISYLMFERERKREAIAKCKGRT